MKKMMFLVVLVVPALAFSATMVPNGDFSGGPSRWNFSHGAWVESAEHPDDPEMMCGRLENGGGGAQDIRSDLFAVPNVSTFIFSFNSGIWQETTAELHPVFQVRFYGSKDHGDLIGDVKFDIQSREGDWWGLTTENSGQFTAPAGTTYMDVVITVGAHNAWQGGARVSHIVLDTPDGLAPSKGALPIYFDITEPGVTKRLDYWGMDQTWIDGWNMDQAIERIGHDDFNSVRLNFLAVEPLTYDAHGNPQLTETMKEFVGRGMDQAMKVPTANLTMHLTAKHDLDPWYLGSDGLIDPVKKVDGAVAMINYIEEMYGYTIDRWDFVEPINEPDWEYPYSNPANMAAIMAEFRSRPELDTVPLLGPSTLSSDAAYTWYGGTSHYTDIGGTHVINGSMDSFIGFIQWIHHDGKPFINPEFHSFIELMIQADLSGDRPGEGGIFWHHVVPAEGRFIQACKGKRIAYEMDPVTWSGTSVYRDTEGRIWLFAASNERHALDSTWEFISSDRDVFFDGVGPTTRKTITMGKHAHWHAEVTWGDRNPMYESQYIDNVGENTRMSVIDGEPNTVSTTDTGDFARWRFRPTGAFYYIDNVGAYDAGQHSRLRASADHLTVELVSSSFNDDFVKWQLIQTDDNFYLENIGMQRAGLASRLKAGSVQLTDSSDTAASAQWSFTDTGAGHANLIPNGDFEDGWTGWFGGGDNGGYVNRVEEGGNHFMYIETGNDGNADLRSALFEVPAGQTLTYSFNSGIWQETAPGYCPQFQVMFYNELGDAPGGWLGQEWIDILRTDGDWGGISTLNTGTITPPEGTKYLDVRFRGGWPTDWKGGFKIDNVTVTPFFHPGDINKDGAVNLLDLAVIARDWHVVYDINDLYMLAENWLKTSY